jgi:regulator of sirC expression with transglutaminase-like and TPR domain
MELADRFAVELRAEDGVQRLDVLAALIGATLAGSADAVDEVLGTLDELAASVEPTFSGVLRALFASGRLRGNSVDYADPRNSYLHEVLRRGLGIPITLSVCAIEVGRRIGIVVDGVGLPGHFIVRSGPLYADPFNAGRTFPAEAVEGEWQRQVGQRHRLDPAMLAATSPRLIALRMLNNLRNTLVAGSDPLALAGLARLRGSFPELAHEEREHSRWMRHWN